MPSRKNTEFAKVICYDRWHDLYVYGGNWSPYIRSQGGDCSDTVTDVCDAVLNGTAMAWTRHGLSTENWRPPSMGGNADPNNGPFGAIMVDDPSQFPADAAVLIALHHGPGGGENSHMWCEIDPAGHYLKVETNGDDGTVLNDGVNYLDEVLDVRAVDGVNGQYGANNWWYLRGPIVEDGTPLTTGPSSSSVPTPASPSVDTLFADVSEWQGVPVNSTYPYKTISIRAFDGDHVDNLWQQNYAYCCAQADAGAWPFFLVYFVWRPGYDNVGQLQRVIGGNPHPKMAIELDVESWGGEITGDNSAALNADRTAIGAWLGSVQRVGGYGNGGDLDTLWPGRPDDLVVRLAAFGSNPDFAGKVSHQYTNGQGYGGGLPESAPPWSACDMNSADGLDPVAFAAAYGITSSAPVVTPPAPPPASPQFSYPTTDLMVRQLWEQAFGPQAAGWASLFGMSDDGSRGRFADEALAQVLDGVKALQAAGTAPAKATKPRKTPAKRKASTHAR